MKRTQPAANVATLHLVGLLLASIGLTAACGDGGASDDCAKLVDAYANAQSRCKISPFADAQKNWSDAFMCDKVKSSNSSKIDTCVNALSAADCGSLMNNTFPVSCADPGLSR
jgi:hypothetical protein